MSYCIKKLTRLIQNNGPIKTIRISSAQASGKAKNYPYWGAVRYEIRLRKSDGVPINAAIERASSDRRSLDLAWEDAIEIAKKENRIIMAEVGALNELSAKIVLRDINSCFNCRYPNEHHTSCKICNGKRIAPIPYMEII